MALSVPRAASLAAAASRTAGSPESSCRAYQSSRIGRWRNAMPVALSAAITAAAAMATLLPRRREGAGGPARGGSTPGANMPPFYGTRAAPGIFPLRRGRLTRAESPRARGGRPAR